MTRSRVGFLGILATGVGLLVLAGTLYLRTEGPTPGLVVEEPHQFVDDLFPGASRDVDFCIKNRTDGPLRIVGVIAP